jgi:hypothetical protein
MSHWPLFSFFCCRVGSLVGVVALLCYWVGRLKAQWDTDGPWIKTKHRGLEGFRGQLELAVGLGGCSSGNTRTPRGISDAEVIVVGRQFSADGAWHKGVAWWRWVLEGAPGAACWRFWS